LERFSPPEDPVALLEFFHFGLTTQEVAALLTHGNDRPDRVAAENTLLELVYDGRAERHAIGDDAVWVAPDSIDRPPPSAGPATRPLAMRLRPY
jgi:hypothetical protein